MKVSLLKNEDLSIEIVDRILFQGLEDKGETGDCIMVLGSKKAPKYRIPKAVAVYENKRASKILLCGGKILNSEFGPFSEAELMRRRALELLIPQNDILVEDTSMTTRENMICSLLPLDREFRLNRIQKILLVTTNYHMRRSLLLAQMYMPGWIKYSPCPAEDTNTRRDNWFKNEKGYLRATEEARKIIRYINDTSIPDFDI